MTSAEHPKAKYRQLDKARGKRHVNVTLTAEEYQFVCLKAEGAGENVTAYFKSAALHQIAEKRHLSDAELTILREGIVQLRKVGTNINQIAHQVNAGLQVNQDELKYQLRYLEDLVQQYFGRKT
jgi:hypothetical protein